jgi:hypothetical protein
MSSEKINKRRAWILFDGLGEIGAWHSPGQEW